MSLSIGQQAPDFTLFNTEKQQVTLSSLKGQPVVLLFFPLAFTSVCTAELCSMRDDIAAYDGLNAKVFGISVDSLFTLGKFKQAERLNFELLSDFNAEVSKAYGTCYDEFVLGMKNVSKRSAFVIDADGMVKYVEVLENAGDVPNFEAVKEALS